MSKILTILLTLSVIFSSDTFAMSLSDKAAETAKNKTAEYVQVVKLTSDEASQVYQILLVKEQNTLEAREKYKGDKLGFKAATKPMNQKYNRQIKDLIGKDKMKTMNKYFKAKKASN